MAVFVIYFKFVFPQYFGETITFPPIFARFIYFPLCSFNLRFLTSFTVFASPYFDHDAFMPLLILSHRCHHHHLCLRHLPILLLLLLLLLILITIVTIVVFLKVIKISRTLIIIINIFFILIVINFVINIIVSFVIILVFLTS